MKYRPKTPMRGYQARALKKAVKNRGVIALHMPMRSGKTKTAIDIACACRLLFGRPQRVLVVCPMSVIGVWVNELAKHSPLPWVAQTRFGFSDDSIRNTGKPLAVKMPGIHWKIVNYEAVYTRERYETEDGYAYMMVPNKELYDFNPEMIILDEATAVGNPTTHQSSKIFKLKKDLQVPMVINLTGTPFHRKILYSFGQFKILNHEIFGTNFGAYKKTYGVWGGHSATKLLYYINLPQFREKIEPWVFTMKHIPPMAPVHQVVPVPFQTGVDKYKEMADEAYIEIQGKEVEAPLIITRIRKLAQIANGYARDNEGDVVRIGDDKENFGADHLASLRSQGLRKVVIVVEETPQLAQAARAASSAGYRTILFYGKSKSRDRRISTFQEAEGHVAMIMQINTGSMGIDLSEADTMLFWVPPTSLMQWDQVCARIRKYKDMRTLLYQYLLMEGTIEQAKYLALQQNLELSKLVGDHPSLISYQEAG